MNNLNYVCGTEDKLALLLRGGEVLRYHAEGKRVEKQYVSDHTWRVVTILLHLFPDASRDLILAAHYHDVAEAFTGDPSAVLKRSNPKISEQMGEVEQEFHRSLEIPYSRDLGAIEHFRLKVADYLELYILCVQQPTADAQRIAENGLKLCLEYVEELSWASGRSTSKLKEEVLEIADSFRELSSTDGGSNE